MILSCRFTSETSSPSEDSHRFRKPRGCEKRSAQVIFEVLERRKMQFQAEKGNLQKANDESIVPTVHLVTRPHCMAPVLELH